MRLWLPVFMAWLIKALVLRYGGLRGYRAALPFFIGLVLGEFALGFVRTVLDGTLGLSVHPVRDRWAVAGRRRREEWS